MRIENYKSNQTIVDTDTYTALLSYGVPQVVVCKDNHMLGATVLVNNQKYSNTTSKHKNAYVRELCDKSYTIIPALPSEIEEITGLETR